MNLVFIAAFIAACGAAKLDRTYLPPITSQHAGGAPGSLQTPFIGTGINQEFLQTPFGRTSDNNPSQGNQLPSGSYENEHQGVVVEAAAPGTRASNQPSGLGGPRENYGSTDSKVGDAAFRDTKYQAGNGNVDYQNQAQIGSFQPQGPRPNNEDNPDLSAFSKPPGKIDAGYRPGNQLFTDRVSNTVKYHMNIGLNKFNYGFETENGIKMEENGVSSDGVKTQGGYSYTGDDGKVYTVMYTADKEGYRPTGSHLPTPPPIPPEILESLQQNARDEANGIQDDGSYDAQKYNAEDDYTQSVANGNYYDRQSNFGNPQPGSNAGTSAVISQDQQGFVRPNSQGQFSSYNFSKESSLSTQADSSKFGAGVTESDNTPNKGNNLAQNGQTTQFNNRFGAQFQFIPPYPGYFQKENPALEIDSSKVGFNNNFNNAQPHSEQEFQNNESAGKPISTLTKLNSYGTSSGYETSNNQQTPSSQISHSFDNSPQNDGTLSQTTSIPNTVGITSAQNSVISSYQNQESFSQTDVQSTSDSKIENTNPDFINRFSHTSSPQTVPTKIPELTLTTPLENQAHTTNSESSELGISFIDSQPQNPNSVNFFNSQSNLQIPSAGQFSNTFTLKPLGSDNSHFYNKPSNHFNTPSTYSDSNKTPDISSSPVNSGTQPLGSLFPNTPKGPVFFTQYQSVTGSPKYPQMPTLAPTGSTLATKKEETENNTYQTNDITQATISSFPSITPTYSSQTSSGEVYEYNKPDQGLPISSQEKNTGEYNSKINQQTVLQNEDNTKPQVSIQSNKQFDQSFSTSSISSSGQQTTPSRFGVQTSSTLGQKPSQSQFGTQGTSSFGLIPPVSPFGAHTSSSFEQNPAQQQFSLPTSLSFGQQNTPFRLSAQTSSPFDKKQTDFIGYTSSSFNQQTPTHFNFQTSSPFGKKPSQPQTSSLFGQGTTPSRFGVQTSSSFGQKPTLSSFDAQTTSLFQKQTPSQTNFSFGQQSTLSRFGIESTLGQKSSEPQRGEQTSFSSGSQPTPSRFGIQSGSLFGQNPNLPTFSTSLNQQTIPTRFDSQTSSLFGQQTKPSRFDIQTAPFFGQKPTQPQRGGQTDFSFSNATPPGFGTQTSSSFGQQTIPSRFGIQSSSSSGQETTLSPFGGQTSTLFGQKITPSQFSVHTSSIFGEKTTPSQFGNSLYEQQTKPQFGANVNQEQQNQFEESNEQSENQSNSKTTTFRPSNSQNSQVSLENTNPDGSYQYNKPTTGFSFNEGNKAQTNFGLQQFQINSQLGQQSSQQENFGQQIAGQSDKQVGSQLSQFVTKPNKQFGAQTQSASAEKVFPLSQQTQLGTQFGELLSTQSDEGSFSSTSQSVDAGKLNQQSQVALFPRFPEQSKVTNKPFEFPQPTTFFDNKGSTTSEFSSTSTDNKQYETTSTFSNSQSSFNLQKQEQSQSSQLGEVYQYNKPAQSLQDSSREESNRFGENTQQEQMTGHGQNKLDTTKPITSHLSQSNEKLDNDQSPTQSSDTQADSKPQTASLGILPSSHPFPHLAFYSACCRGSKPQNSQGSQSLSDKNTQHSSFNNNDKQDTNGNGPIENKFDIQGKEPASNRFGEDAQQEKITGQSDQNKLDATKPITSHLSQSNEKFNNDHLVTQNSNESQTQTDSKPQTATLGTLPSSHSFPQLSFYSACCGGSKTQNSQGTQSLLDKVSDSNTTSFNKNDKQDTNGNGPIENKFGIQGKKPAGSNEFGIQKDTHNVTGKGEEFGGPREPPKFDETGYHY